jgi:hypothetical protein
MEDLLYKMDQNDLKNIFILTITDYDPAGYYISDALKKQVEALKLGLDINAEVHIERLGITPNQLTPEEVEQNKYTPKPANMYKWLEATGGINGEAKGIELDALTPDRIRALFVSSIKKYVDPDLYVSFVKESHLKETILRKLEPRINEIVDEVTEEELEFVVLIDFDIFDLAEKGHASIPVNQLCKKNREQEIEEKVSAYFIDSIL